MVWLKTSRRSESVDKCSHSFYKSQSSRLGALNSSVPCITVHEYMPLKHFCEDKIRSNTGATQVLSFTFQKN